MALIKSHLDIENIQPPLTLGEKKVLDLFESELNDDWEIYVQPHINGLKPDFVLINPNSAIGVFEVKDWKLKERNYQFIKNTNQLSTESSNEVFPNPINQINKYKQLILELYCPRLRESFHKGYPAITAGLIFPFATEEVVTELFQNSKSLLSGYKVGDQYTPISGSNAINSRDLKAIFPESSRVKSNLINKETTKDFRDYLLEPDYIQEINNPIRLDKVQKTFVDTKSKNGFRRIKGPAGSGKSLILASKAAMLASRGKRILLLTYNITIRNYLFDLCKNVRSDCPYKSIEINSFHEWLKGELKYKNNESYKKIWKDHFNSDQEINSSLALQVSTLMQELSVNKNLESDLYDAIIVDEGQDFEPSWWKLLMQYKKVDGQMILAADSSQSLYLLKEKWTDLPMLDCGFSGKWYELKHSYRLPETIKNFAALFAKNYLPPEMQNLPTYSQSELALEDCKIKWISINDNLSSIVDTCVIETINMPMENEGAKTTFSDLIVVCDKNKYGSLISSALNDKGYETLDVFSENQYIERRKKVTFNPKIPKIKVCSVNSFKGWEARCIIFSLTSAKQLTDFYRIYTALTRVKKHPNNSFLTVVSSCDNLNSFSNKIINNSSYSELK